MTSYLFILLGAVLVNNVVFVRILVFVVRGDDRGSGEAGKIAPTFEQGLGGQQFGEFTPGEHIGGQHVLIPSGAHSKRHGKTSWRMFVIEPFRTLSTIGIVGYKRERI